MFFEEAGYGVAFQRIFGHTVNLIYASHSHILKSSEQVVMHLSVSKHMIGSLSSIPCFHGLTLTIKLIAQNLSQHACSTEWDAQHNTTHQIGIIPMTHYEMKILINCEEL